MPFSVDSQLELIIILSRAVELCQVKCGTGGAGVEWLTESAVKISEIFLKVTNTAEIQHHVAPNRYQMTYKAM